ncbi:hypothetical protein SAMN05428946_0997 [Edaphobacillus lindanitolerans]|uniref:Uncharacterized protein n=2 Tax=Edaphobacillus lindanitolerans TaxID=550447 RepID=A0A1U7PNK2_9BACI|nr:hypothetical protein SAMN05428946_0997 [Edaphobacillus lindanitolerans]
MLPAMKSEWGQVAQVSVRIGREGDGMSVTPQKPFWSAEGWSERLEIVETGWATEREFIVVLEAEKEEFLQSEGAQAYAGVVAGRRRCKTAVRSGSIEEGETLPFKRAFLFTR